MSFVYFFFQTAFHNLEVRFGKNKTKQNIIYVGRSYKKVNGAERAAESEAGVNGNRASCLGSKLSPLSKILRKETSFGGSKRYKVS